LYLVVAADKGARPLSPHRQFRVRGIQLLAGDAFASGGSVGYDHKKMGITAKGAWRASSAISAAGRRYANQTLTVVGIGDMSGDVFGNGMLPRGHRAARGLDHRHIFLDPSPTRRRASGSASLFNLPLLVGRLRQVADLERRWRVPALGKTIALTRRR
jgi:glutamate dehydrogenase